MSSHASCNTLHITAASVDIVPWPVAIPYLVHYDAYHHVELILRAAVISYAYFTIV